MTMIANRRTGVGCCRHEIASGGGARSTANLTGNLGSAFIASSTSLLVNGGGVKCRWSDSNQGGGKADPSYLKVMQATRRCSSWPSKPEIRGVIKPPSPCGYGEEKDGRLPISALKTRKSFYNWSEKDPSRNGFFTHQFLAGFS